MQRLQAWLDRVEQVPARGGVANISAIAVAAAVDRQVLYRPEARALIAAAVVRKGLGMPDQQRALGADELPAWAKQRLSNLEQQAAAMRAENAELRGRLRRYEVLESHLTETGRLAR